MKKFLILLCLLFAAESHAYTNGYLAAAIQGGPGGGGCTYETACAAGCTLFSWNMASTTVTGNTCVVSGDATATLTGATVSGNVLNLIDGSDRASFDISAYDIFPAGEVTVQMDVNFTTITSGSYLFSAYFDANNNLKIYFSGTKILVMHSGGGGGLFTTFTGSEVATSTATKLIIKVGYAGIELKESVDAGENWTTFSYPSSGFTPMNHSGTAAIGLRIGNTATGTLAGTIDNVIISAGWRTDI